MTFLLRDNDVWTSARDNGSGIPITDVSVKESIAYDSYDDAMKINSMYKKFRDPFSGSALNPNNWNVIEQMVGTSYSVSNGVLTISTGTSANSEIILESVQTFTNPTRIMASLQLSQKIANQEFAIEIVSVNPSTLADDGQNLGAWNISYDDNTSNQYAVYEVTNGGLPKLRSSSQYIANAQTGAYGLYEIEAFSDEMWFHTRAVDSVNGRSTSFVRQNQIPDPNAIYKIRLRAKNKATAPASSTNFMIQFVYIVDYAELTAEITAGRGNVAAGQATGVQVLNAPSAYIYGGALGSNSTTNLGANAVYTSSTTDGGSSSYSYNRCRVVVAHTAGLTHGYLTLEVSTDNVTFRETHRVPIPSDGNYRTFDFPITARYHRFKFTNGAVAQTSFFINGMLVRQDGACDYDKTMTFIHSTTALTSGNSFVGNTMDLGSNHSINRHRALAYADQAGTLYLEQSRDNVNWRTMQTATVNAGNVVEVEDLVISRYVRARYVNGATTNTVFELQSALVRQ